MKIPVYATAFTLLAVPTTLRAQDAPSNDGSSLHGDPLTPVGGLTVTPTVVQPGVQPNMKWGIDYPKSIADLAIVKPSGRLVTINEKTEKVEIRVAGVSNSGSEGSDLPVALWVRVDSGAWDLVFYGTEKEVDATTPIFSQTVSSGTQIDFASRSADSSSGWNDTQWTVEDSPNIAGLINEDPAPPESSAFYNGGAESFMTQHLDENSEIVAGPRDIIHVFELDDSEAGDSDFDMQDIVIVTTFKNNNGHGNNEDGVDVSNPGQGSGGPNGEVDESGHIDDEKQHIKRKNQ